MQVRPLDGVIQWLWDALKIGPPCFRVSFGLAVAFIIRYRTMHSNEDYEEAMNLLESVVPPNPPGESTGASQAIASVVATTFTSLWASIYPNPQYLEEFYTPNSNPCQAALQELRFHRNPSRSSFIYFQNGQPRLIILSSWQCQEDIDKADAVRAVYPMKEIITFANQSPRLLQGTLTIKGTSRVL
ncbi:hypothetical protein B0F90DRAFT_1752813 [Multifurca ochricompacta]|uniref:Uncharacterized protein n=1 Tax=Multifurca ochricompacta TaxID=376703 RepID=A0AAD4LYI8_9AGAM|nr:hypothetical protein B0F90DRAFT_1752813 [Multifurca ochricompacta]